MTTPPKTRAAKGPTAAALFKADIVLKVYGPIIVDLLQANPRQTLAGLTSAFNTDNGTKISGSTMKSWLETLGISYKIVTVWSGVPERQESEDTDKP